MKKILIIKKISKNMSQEQQYNNEQLHKFQSILKIK